MSKSTLFLLATWLLAFPFLTFSQEENAKPSLLSKVGIGGIYIGSDNFFFLTASYNRILTKRNELEFPIYYIGDGRTNELVAGAAFNWATIKKDRRFNLFISPEIQFNNYWYPRYDGKTTSRYGYFFCIGLIPSYQISSHFSTSFEWKLGHGYQWAKNDEYFIGDRTYYSARGWYYRVLVGLKLYYHFK